MTGLLDMLKEADLRVGFTDLFATATAREHLDRPTHASPHDGLRGRARELAG